MGLFGSKKKPKPQIVAHKYYVGMHMIVGHSYMDALEKIRVGEKTAWSASESVKESFTSLNTAYNTPHPDTWLAQTFTTLSSYTISSVTLKLRRTNGDLPGTVTVSIRATSSGVPIGDDLCVGTTDGNTILNNPATLSLSTERNIKFNIPIVLAASTKYAICVRTTNAPDILFWIGNSTGGYSGGNYLNSAYRGETGSWNSYTNIDFWFKTYKINGTPPNSSVSISAANLFGGDRKEGGVSGTVDLLFGATDQEQNSYLVARLGSAITAFRGLMSFVLRQVYVGTSPYIKPWAFFCKRINTQVSGLDQWYKEKAVLNPRKVSGDDLNAAHIIRECLIDPEWGLGFDASSDLDDDAWKLAADILYDENFGLSLEWDQSQPVEDFIGEILRCINGMLYQDLSTGKLVLSLTREPSIAEVLQESYITGEDNTFGSIYDSNWAAQTFTPTVDYTISSVKLKLIRTGAIDVPFYVSIRNTSSLLPAGNDLAICTLQSSDITTDAGGAWYEADFRHGTALTAGQRYAIVIRVPNGTDPTSVNWRVEYDGSYTEGALCTSSDSGLSWTAQNYDAMFETYSHGMLKDIVVHGVDDIIEIEDFVRPSYGEITNQLIVNWWDKVADKSRPAMVHDIALIEKQNGTINEHTISYYGICNAALANIVAERDLNLVSGMLASMRIKATRKLSNLKPNEIFKLTWPALGITQMVVRVMEINYGDLEKTEVYLSCVEDSFLTALTIYSDPPDSLWTDLISEAVDIINRRLIEVPYYSLCKDFENQSIINGYDDDAGFMFIVAAPPVEDSFDFNYEIKHAVGLDYTLEGVGTYSPTATIAVDIARNATDLDIDLGNVSNLEQVVEGSYAILNDEIVRINSVDSDNNQINISRGILDTVPEAHSSGDRIYFAGTNYEGVNTEYTVGEEPLVKIYPRTGKGILAATAITTQITMGSRMIRPYPPGNLKFNGESYPNFFSSSAHGNKIEITWNHRDRTASNQLQSLIKHTAGDVGVIEAGTTYTVEVYGIYKEGDAEVEGANSPYTGLSGVSTLWDYTETMEAGGGGDFAVLQGQLRFVIYAVRDGYNSWNDGYDITLRRAFRGTVDATSSLIGDISTYFERNQDTDAISSVDGTLSVATQLAGSATGTGNTSATLYGVPKLIGSSTATSSASGSLTVPINEVIQDHYNIDDDSASEDGKAGAYGTRWEAQSFTANQTYTITEAKLLLSADLDATGKTLTVSIRATVGGKPSGGDLCSGTIAGASVPIDDGNRDWLTVDFGAGTPLTNGQVYAICIRSDEVAANISWWVDLTSPSYAGGQRVVSNNIGVDWTLIAHDFLFETYGG